MDFEWTQEQQLKYEQAKSLGEELAATAGDEAGVFRRETWQAIGASGILGVRLPRDLGGQELDVLTAVLTLEGLGYGCRDNGLTLGINGTIWAVQDPILEFGTTEQKERWLPALSSGQAIGSHAMTEQGSGSDAFSLSTSATKSNGGFVLNGEKRFVGMAPVADVAIVFANSDPSAGQWGISAFLVDTAAEGVILGPAQAKMGLNSDPMGSIVFEDCWVPESSLLGPEGAGVAIFNHTMEWERSFVLASHVGAMNRQLDEAIAFANQRHQFGSPIGKNQAVSHRIANMKLRLEASQMLLYKAAWLKQRGESAPLTAALTKLQISEAFTSSSLDSIRVHGGIGYLSDQGIEADLRDSVGGLIYSGTSDLQREVIVRMLGL